MSPPRPQRYASFSEKPPSLPYLFLLHPPEATQTESLQPGSDATDLPLRRKAHTWKRVPRPLTYFHVGYHMLGYVGYHMLRHDGYHMLGYVGYRMLRHNGYHMLGYVEYHMLRHNGYRHISPCSQERPRRGR